MQTESIVLGKRSLRDSFLTAIKHCEEIKKIQPGYIKHDQIRFLQDVPAKTEIDKARTYDIEARQIARAFHEAKKAVIVDGNSLESGLALLHQYKKHWKIDDDVVEKLNIVVYDPEMPDRAEIVQDIKEALVLLERFRQQNKVTFITLPGHAFNFAMELAESKKDKLDLPDLKKIVEIKPEDAWALIKTKITTGKKVFIDKALIEQNPGIAFMLKTLNKEQRSRYRCG